MVSTHWLNMLETISISASAAAIFSAEEGGARAPNPNMDMLAGVEGVDLGGCWSLGGWSVVVGFGRWCVQS